MTSNMFTPRYLIEFDHDIILESLAIILLHLALWSDPMRKQSDFFFTLIIMSSRWSYFHIQTILAGVRKTRHKTLYFTHLPRSPQWVDLYQIWFRVSSHGRNQLCGILLQSAHGFRFCEGSKFVISHWLGRPPLTQRSLWLLVTSAWCLPMRTNKLCSFLSGITVNWYKRCRRYHASLFCLQHYTTQREYSRLARWLCG